MATPSSRSRRGRRHGNEYDQGQSTQENAQYMQNFSSAPQANESRDVSNMNYGTRAVDELRTHFHSQMNIDQPPETRMPDTYDESAQAAAFGTGPNFSSSQSNTSYTVHPATTSTRSGQARKASFNVPPKNWIKLKAEEFLPGFVFQCYSYQEDTAIKENATSPSIVNEDTFNGDQQLFSKVQMYVVLRDNEDYSCTCFSVQTYRRQGVSKRGLKKSNFAIFYSGDQVPEPLLHELPRNSKERGMRKPIRVELADEQDGIDPMSRIHLRALHCCQMNVKVHPIGTIALESWETLLAEHQAVLKDKSGRVGRKKTKGNNNDNHDNKYDEYDEYEEYDEYGDPGEMSKKSYNNLYPTGGAYNHHSGYTYVN